MTIILKTKVPGNYKKVMERFDRDLFEALKPPIGMEIEKFTGSKKGDQVVLKFTFPAKFTWQSDIIEDGHDEKRAWFVDKGIILPWPLKTWEHQHIVERIDDENCSIIDHMTYTCGNALLTTIIKPFLFGAFYPRKKIYQSYFAEK